MKSPRHAAPSEDDLVQRLRLLCLAMPETSETKSWNHPNFRAGKRTFVTFERIGGTPSFAFRLPPSDVQHLLGQPPFFRTPYGRGQWVSLPVLAEPDWALVEHLVHSAYRTVALKRMIAALEADERP